MRQLTNPAKAALDQRAVTIRDFLWLEPRDRSTGDVIQYGMWSDIGTVAANVISPRTGLIESRTFEGGGGLAQISQIPMTSNLTVQTVSITLSQISNANDLIRTYDAKQARVEIFRGLFAPATLVQLAPAFPRFVGYVDGIEINTPAEGGDGSIDLTCVSHSQEMSRYNPATRSDAYQRRRAPGDTFSQHAASVGTWELRWGSPS